MELLVYPVTVLACQRWRFVTYIMPTQVAQTLNAITVILNIMLLAIVLQFEIAFMFLSIHIG